MDELARSALSLAKVMAKTGMRLEEAIAKVALMDPFDQVKDLGRQLKAESREDGPMSSARETVLSMALIMLRRRHPAGAVKREEIAAAVRDCARLLSATLDETEVSAVADEIETRLVVTVGRPTTLFDEQGHVPWYFGKRKEGRRFFRRYADFLRQDQQWAPAAIEAIDTATDLVMEQLEDPEREGQWDRRGLVVGHVQSGKTANYAGLANKAADAGYKLIIVLAGMHNVLRQQTQRRLDRDVLGYNTLATGQGFTRIGVGDYDVSIHAEHLTTQAVNGDFSRAIAERLGMGVQQRPVMLVVKKNAGILKNLNNWVREVLAQRGDTETRPLLVVDDEADQASVEPESRSSTTMTSRTRTTNRNASMARSASCSRHSRARRMWPTRPLPSRTS